jgi:hypothetical protein
MKRMYDTIMHDNICDLLSDIAEYADNEQGVCLRKFLEIRYNCPDVVESCYPPYDCKKCIREFVDQDI